jgi:hypothetical protein
MSGMIEMERKAYFQVLARSVTNLKRYKEKQVVHIGYNDNTPKSQAPTACLFS